MKEKKKEKTKKVGRKPNKQILIFTGIFLVTLGTFLLIFFAGYLGITYSPLIREYAINLEEGEEETVSEERPFVITEEGLIDQSRNIGTGFVVGEDGLIITNQHVVSDDTADYIVVTQDGDEFVVTEIVRDDLNDIAVIKVSLEDGTLQPLVLGDSDALLVGQNVIAIGTPLGQLAGSATTGIISGLERSVTASSGWFGSTAKTYENVIQTDAAVNPGNSGGPLISSQGEVIGINFATTAGADNISFAIPINKIKGRLEEYRTYGKFIRPYLGVTYQMISEYEALYYADVVPGALILRVDPDSPANTAGLKRGDILTQFGEVDVDRPLADIIQEHEVGEEIELVVYRDGEEVTLNVTLGEMD